MSSLTGFSKLRTPNRDFKSARPPYPVKSVMPNESIWRTLEDQGATIVPYNNGHMLRIDGKLDIYPKSLKYRYTHARNTPWKLIKEILHKNETPIQAIKRILTLAPDILLPRQLQKDLSPLISTGTLRAIRRYKKSI